MGSRAHSVSELERLLDASVDWRPETLSSSLLAIVEQGHLRDHLLRARDGDALIRLTALGASEIHPNGFLKVLVAQRPDRWVLRIHVWTRACSEMHVHSHRWNFASHVLTGSMHARGYGIASPSQGDRTRFHCQRTDERYVFHRLGRCVIQQIDEQEHAAGDWYEQPFEALHAIETAGRGPVVTVVLQGADLAEHSTVITPGDAEPALERAVDRLTADQVRQVVDMALRGLTA